MSINLLIDFSAMANGDHGNDELPVIDLKDNAVVADADADVVTFLLLTTKWRGNLLQFWLDFKRWLL
jgi:hypothetical protein